MLTVCPAFLPVLPTEASLPIHLSSIPFSVSLKAHEWCPIVYTAQHLKSYRNQPVIKSSYRAKELGACQSPLFP